MLDLERPCRAQSARLPLEAKLRSGLALMFDILFAVPQHGIGVHADIQLNLHDAANRPLVRLSSVPRSYAPGIPAELLGRNKRTSG